MSAGAWSAHGEPPPPDDEPPPPTTPEVPELPVYYSAATNSLDVRVDTLSSYTDVPEVVIASTDTPLGDEDGMISISIFKLRPGQTAIFAKMQDHVRAQIACNCAQAAYTIKLAEGYAGAFRQLVIARVWELLQLGIVPALGESTIDVFVSADDLDLPATSPTRHFMAINITANLAKHVLPLRLNLGPDHGPDTIVLISCTNTRPSGQPGTLALEVRIQFVSDAPRGAAWMDARGKRVVRVPDPTMQPSRTPSEATAWTRHPI